MARKVLPFTLTSHASFTIATRNLDRTILSSLPSPSKAWIPSAKVIGKSSCLKDRLLLLVPRATADQSGKVEEEVVDSKILPYCSIDKKEKKSIGELEQEFFQALQVYSDLSFDYLKMFLLNVPATVIGLGLDLVQTVVLKTLPLSEQYCRFQAVVLLTILLKLWNSTGV